MLKGKYRVSRDFMNEEHIFLESVNVASKDSSDHCRIRKSDSAPFLLSLEVENLNRKLIKPLQG